MPSLSQLCRDYAEKVTVSIGQILPIPIVVFTVWSTVFMMDRLYPGRRIREMKFNGIYVHEYEVMNSCFKKRDGPKFNMYRSTYEQEHRRIKDRRGYFEDGYLKGSLQSHMPLRIGN
ncbi:unnamed protein product [Brassica rapa]|uniref:Uncharacterized protein n=1 Tax=Brassica campestris TaxID=3711 RepID=A0A3P5Z6N9_BRACM|nr:unnamed protein product [Brassica rapa]VDC75572.1 unnamed protein product [Brassica rapa]